MARSQTGSENGVTLVGSTYRTRFRGTTGSLEVRPVPRLERIVVGDDEPGLLRPRPIRLEAWMYSEAPLGCPTIVIRLSRGASSPTWIMLVA